ncbi:MAG: NfeD family protein [Bacteriovoracaceae bacterium]|nr:NfeD family protein [Bacteriovoracaceae bacterium]
MDFVTFFKWFWWILGSVLVLAEFLLPGLVVVFVGLGALTVAALNYFGFVTTIIPQFLTWFVSSIIYCFTLRLLVIKIYPSDVVKQNSDEDQDVVGQIALVTQMISENKSGRIKHSDSTWPARTSDGSSVETGQSVKIIGRDNLTWIVEKTN